MVRVVHTADWQLGKPFGGFPDDVRSALTEARLDVIDRIGNIAADNAARHILVAGDVFDNVEPGDRILVQALSRMNRAPVNWWLMPGNHDHSRADGLWSRVRAKAPGNVHVLDIPAAVALEDGAWLLPAPLDHRRTRDDPTTMFDAMITPLGAVRIGLAHGSIAVFGKSSEATNIIPPDRAHTSRLDYLALGDWHGHVIVNDRTAYSGTPEADRFGRDEPGSVIVADVRPGDLPQLVRVETGRYRWLKRDWEITHVDDFDRHAGALRAVGDPAKMLLDLTLVGDVSLENRVSILDRLGEDLAHELRWLAVSSDKLIARPTKDDLANIDVQGALAAAAALLQEKIDAGGSDAVRAGAALERLYVEAIRARDETRT